jgi:hypothetical protein
MEFVDSETNSIEFFECWWSDSSEAEKYRLQPKRSGILQREFPQQQHANPASCNGFQQRISSKIAALAGRIGRKTSYKATTTMNIVVCFSVLHVFLLVSNCTCGRKRVWKPTPENTHESWASLLQAQAFRDIQKTKQNKTKQSAGQSHNGSAQDQMTFIKRMVNIQHTKLETHSG